ncbi:MAG: GNAT family N-acetyltransferase, partial [Lachnospiraceae bacterium]
YGCGMWVVEDATKKHPIIIGRVGLEPETYGNQTEWFLGYLIDKRYRNRGLCMEACQLAIAYAVNRLGLSNIYCRIDDSNTISHYIAKKLSFEPFEKEEGSTVYKKKI